MLGWSSRVVGGLLVRGAAGATVSNVSSALRLQVLPTYAVTSSQCLYVTIIRHMSSHRFNRNLEFFSADSKTLIKPEDKESLCVTSLNGPHRPLTLLMCWLMSKDSHVKKFVHFYNDLGFDVLKIRISPFDLIRPVKGSQVVAAQMLEFLHQNPSHSSVLVHGFSVGAYLFCEGLVQVDNNKARHGPLMDRFVGQVWDSPVDLEGIPDGTAKAVTNNELLRASIKKYLEWFLRAQYDQATVHYQRSKAMMHRGCIERPALMFMSRTDPVATVPMVADVYNKWEKKGIPVFVKIFDKSPHVSHFHTHKHEYVEELLTFLQRVELLDAKRKRAVV